ncbi:hypothetical protein BDV09DRAFT_3352 [Aspergillus tetrazonus]
MDSGSECSWVARSRSLCVRMSERCCGFETLTLPQALGCPRSVGSTEWHPMFRLPPGCTLRSAIYLILPNLPLHTKAVDRTPALVRLSWPSALGRCLDVRSESYYLGLVVSLVSGPVFWLCRCGRMILISGCKRPSTGWPWISAWWVDGLETGRTSI